MIIEVTHRTELTYSGNIAETVMELRLRPLDGLGQECRDFDLKVTPRSRVASYRDGFGNHVHYFNYLPPHDRVSVVSRSVVQTALPPIADGHDFLPDEFLQFRAPVVRVAGIRKIADRFRVRDTADADAVEAALDQLSSHINAEFKYLPQTTDVFTGVEEVLKLRSGVCQDFAHLFIAVARTIGVPTRYVSGYIHAGKGHRGAGASHAWAEAWLPGKGWVGYDPTNPVKSGPHHIRVAVGRDYRDVAPHRGVYLGPAAEAMRVSVVTRVAEKD